MRPGRLPENHPLEQAARDQLRQQGAYQPPVAPEDVPDVQKALAPKGRGRQVVRIPMRQHPKTGRWN